MVAKTLESLTLTEAERKLAGETLRVKMQSRGRLRQQLMELDELARDPKSDAAALAKALAQFQDAAAQQQQRGAGHRRCG